VSDLQLLLRAPHGRPIAANAVNTITLSTVALGQLAVRPFDIEHPEEPFALELEPIYGAYVVCLQRTLGGTPVDVPFLPRFGRTNNLGWMLERDRDDADGPIPQATVLPQQTLFGEPVGDSVPIPARDQLLLDPGETYELFWSLDRERFEQCCQALEQTGGSFPKEFATHRIVFRELQAVDTRELELGDARLGERVGRHLLRTGAAHGCIREREIGFDVGVFDVTAAPLRALYLCEFLQWYTVCGLQKSSKNLAVLTRVRNLVEAAHHGRPDFEMDAQFKAAPGTPERAVLDHYRDFVWQCAANGVLVKDVERALQVTQARLQNIDEQAWLKAAEEIRRVTRGRATHPVFRDISPRNRLVLDSSTQDLLADYFSMYRLGARLRKRYFAERVGSESERLAAVTAANQECKAQLLRRYAVHTDFVEALDRTLPPDGGRRQALLERYWLVCADACYAWWEPLEAYAADDWKRLRTRAKWITGEVGGFGKAFKGFLERPLKAYKLSFEKANAALTTFFRYHATAAQHQGLLVFEEKLPSLQTKVRVDFRSNTITVLEAFDGTTQVGEPISFLFTTIVQELDPAELKPPPGNMTSKRRQRFDLAKASGKVVEYDVELPVDARKARALGLELPAALGLACGSLNTALGVLAAADELKRGFKLERENIEAWFELGKNVVGLVDSLSAVQEAMAPKIDGYSPLLKRMSSAVNVASRSVAVLDSAYNLATGLELLFSDDGAVAYELRQGRSVRAQALRAKGVVQLASAAASGAMAAGALAMFGGGATAGALALAAGPVGLALAAGGILVVCIDATLSLTHELGEQTSALEAALDRAEREEFASTEVSQPKRLRLADRFLNLQEKVQAARV
jgi:hypothetical protein